MAIREISPREAHERMNSGEGCVYVDVRSVGEFAEGHPASAVNVPILQPDPATRRMAPNPDFLQVVQANFAPDRPLLLGCLSGGRSAMAVEALQRAGYQNVVNVRCGFGGARDMLGQVVEPGWAGLGLPVEKEETPGASYAALRGQVGS
jgi:rhodanese-related sulfurtransferase